MYMGRCVFCIVNAYALVHMCMCYHSHGCHQSLTDMEQMFSSVPVDPDKSKQLEEETSEKKIRAKQPSGCYQCPETGPAGKRFCLCICFWNKAFTHTRRFLSQSFSCGDDSWNKEGLKDILVVSFCKFSLWEVSYCWIGREKKGRNPLRLHW